MENKNVVARSPMDMHTFGPSVVLAMVGLSFAFGGEPNAHGVGLVLGRMATSACLALPVYLAVRFGTKRGRVLPAARRLNLLCLLVVVIWVLQLVALAVLEHQFRKAPEANFFSEFAPPTSTPARPQSKPNAFEDLIPKAGQIPQAAKDGTKGQSSGTNWSDFTPTDGPAAAIGCNDMAPTACVCTRNRAGRRFQPGQLPLDSPSKLADLLDQCVCAGIKVDLNDQSCIARINWQRTAIR